MNEKMFWVEKICYTIILINRIKYSLKLVKIILKKEKMIFSLKFYKKIVIQLTNGLTTNLY